MVVRYNGNSDNGSLDDRCHDLYCVLSHGWNGIYHVDNNKGVNLRSKKNVQKPISL